MSKQHRDQNRAERAAAIRAAQDRKERNRRIGLIVAIVVVLGAVVAGGAWYTAGGSTGGDSDPAVAVSAGAGSVVVGEPTARVKVVIYEDFQCPYCRQLEDQTRDFLRENAAAGKVQVEYRPVNLLTDLAYSANGLNAFAAVLAHSTPQAALKLHDLLYDNQPYESDSADVSASDIAALVKKAGGENSAVSTALKTQDDAFFTAADAVMQEKGIQGTPTVYVNGTAVTGGVSELVDAIENAVG